MPKMITKVADKTHQRSRDSVGRTKLYNIDFAPLKDVIGKTKEDGSPQQVLYEPDDMTGSDGSVAQLSTFLAQARHWVDEYNESLPEGELGFRIKSESFPVMKNGNQVKGTVKDGKIVPDKDGTPLNDVYVGVVPLKDSDMRRRQAMKDARAKARAEKEGSAEQAGNGQAAESQASAKS